MKKIYFLIPAGLIIAILVGFWVYSFLYGSPENRDSFFTDLGLFGGNNEVLPISPELPPEPMVEVSADPLRQLTTRPVIGMRLLENSSSTIMRYVEAGTGHIYDIDMVTGSENRVSQISIPVATEAVISPNGDYVAIRSGSGNQNEVSLISLFSAGSPERTILPNQIEEFHFGFNNELLFTEMVGTITEGKGYLPSTKSVRRLFSVPLTAINMVWSDSTTTPHRLYTKPAENLTGYAYEIRDGGIRRLPFSGLGLTLTSSPEGFIIGRVTGAYYQTTYRKLAGGNETVIPNIYIPDKCVVLGGVRELMICGAPLMTTDRTILESWNKGVISTDDRLWSVRLGYESTQLTYPLEAVGRSIDVTDPHISTDNKMVYFINRLDNTLWLYEL
jgi:hypothetical protein